MTQDKFADYLIGLESPATELLAVTPDDGVDLERVSRALNVATAGSVQLTTLGGDTATVYVAPGSAFPVRAVRVWATGTTATGIVAMS